MALSILAYIILDAGGALGGLAETKRTLVLNPLDLSLYQFFSYQFLHGDMLHLGGNMLFLWIFGNAVNSKMGNWAYLLFYLAGGVFAGIVFALTSHNPVLGASGAIAAVTTAYLVLFPQSAVTIFYWIWFYIGTAHIQAMMLIVVKIILWDNILAPNVLRHGTYETVAYSAHLGGYLFGFTVAAVLLMIRAVPRDQFDIVALLSRYYRRQQYRAEMANPQTEAEARFGRVARPTGAFKGRPIEVGLSAAETEIMAIRAEISQLLGQGDYVRATERYEALTTRDATQVLSRGNMLLIANQLASLGKYSQAAAAYEKYIKAYSRESDVLQVKCMLGIIYAKYLSQNDTAEPLLRECATKTRDPQQKALAEQWLDFVVSGLRPGPSVG